MTLTKGGLTVVPRVMEQAQGESEIDEYGQISRMKANYQYPIPICSKNNLWNAMSIA